jgi:succinyl-diaminopimelate desuccinylase
VNVTRLLQELIALPSVNPAFLPVNHAWAGEMRVADFLAETASKWRLDVEFQRVDGPRANVLIRCSPARRARNRIILAPHIDTVGGDNLERLLKPRHAGVRLYGRGACDTKGSVAAMLSALAKVANASRRPAETEILLAALVDEESIQAGSRTLVKSRLRADFAIVGEPTRLKVVTAHKGVLWLELKTHGKAAHGARPELGKNAVHEMARAVDLLETKYAGQIARRKHPLLGHATVNVGAIHGGRQPNIVPAECSALLDRRLLPYETDAKVIREIKDLFASQKLSVKIKPTHPAACFALETDPRNRWVTALMSSVRQGSPVGVDYFSDAGVLSDAGIPSVLFGPGDIAQAHTPDEWIDVRQLQRATDMLASFLQSLP